MSVKNQNRWRDSADCILAESFFAAGYFVFEQVFLCCCIMKYIHRFGGAFMTQSKWIFLAVLITS